MHRTLINTSPQPTLPESLMDPEDALPPYYTAEIIGQDDISITVEGAEADSPSDMQQLALQRIHQVVYQKIEQIAIQRQLPLSYLLHPRYTLLSSERHPDGATQFIFKTVFYAFVPEQFL